jgi:hypothetical protein
MESMQNANSESHYKLLVVAIVIGLAGVYIRFLDFNYSSAIANFILVIGAVIALRAVFAIIK